MVVRFRTDWDDLRGLNDIKRALQKPQGTFYLSEENIKYELGQEEIKSLATYGKFFSKSY
ncbi:MAG: hypothetical protein GWN86_16415, partial [Desulfobacterales bacterium]|nr:hypothetical protein [Desulfobacterales bacterium]